MIINHTIKSIFICLKLILSGDFNTLRYRVKFTLDRFQRKNNIPIVKLNDTIGILCTPHTQYVALLIKEELTIAGYKSEIYFKIPIRKYVIKLFIVICPQFFNKLPPHYVAFQMEQSISDRWFTKKYLQQLFDAIAVLDYSTHNIEYLINRGLDAKNLYFTPLSIMERLIDISDISNYFLNKNTREEYDVVFYGDINNERRRRFLKAISARYRVLILNNIFGQELYLRLISVGVVVNIHYYENALLETPRIFECLSLGLTVVSEKGIDHDEHTDLFNRVRFVEQDNIESMITEIENAIVYRKHLSSFSPEELVKSDHSLNRFRFYFNRFLLAHDLIDFDFFFSRFPSQGINEKAPICLSLTETPQRNRTFRCCYGDHFQIVEGLRHRIGWVGCALSYKYYSMLAILQGLNRLVMCEDDVLLPHNFEDTLRSILRYLEVKDQQWDIFCGLIASLSDDTVVNNVEYKDQLAFVSLNKMTSMVFNIYSARALAILADWKPSFRDAKSNTIDRYLERLNLRVITTNPFMFGHRSDLKSTLWGFSNKTYDELIQSSNRKIAKMIKNFEARNGS